MLLSCLNRVKFVSQGDGNGVAKDKKLGVWGQISDFMEKNNMKYPPKSLFVCKWKAHWLDYTHNLSKSMLNSFGELMWEL